MKSTLLFLPGILFTLSFVAHAERPERLAAHPVYPEKHSGPAYALALGGTALPVAAGIFLVRSDRDAPGGVLLATGILLGPSLGQFYAGSLGAGLGGTLLRTSGSMLLFAGAAEALDDWDCNEDRKCDNNDGTAIGLMGLAAFSAGVVYSLVDTHFAVKRANSDAWQMAPDIQLSRDGSPRLGAQALKRF